VVIRSTHDALVEIFYQRCFWLFAALLLLIAAVSFIPGGDHGRLILNVVNMFVLIATVIAVGRTRLSFVITLLLAVPAVVYQYIGLWQDSEADLATSWGFTAMLYFITISYLIRYVFQPKVMTQDKLCGAAAAYLLIGVLWAYFYIIIGYHFPESYMTLGQPGQLDYAGALYLSISSLTSSGFGDLAPLTRPARGACMLEQLTGALFVALLIARLAGVYPAREHYVDDQES